MFPPKTTSFFSNNAVLKRQTNIFFKSQLVLVNSFQVINRIKYIKSLKTKQLHQTRGTIELKYVKVIVLTFMRTK